MRPVPTLLLAAALLVTAACEGSDRPTGPAASSARIAADNSSSDGQGGDDGQLVLDVRHMSGNVLVGATGAVRGVPAGGLPWVLKRARVRLRADDRLRVEVRGLVLAAGAAAGTNAVPQFRAVLSCLVVNAGGTGYDTVTVASDPAPATTGGNATIEQRLSGVPDRCLAPVVFVTSPTQAWFAVTG